MKEIDKKSSRWITDEETESFIKCYKEGMSAKKIAEKFGRDQSGILKILKKNGIEIVPQKEYVRKMGDEQEKNLIKIYEKLGTMAKVKEETGIAMATIKRILNKHGIDTSKKNTKRQFIKDNKELIIKEYRKYGNATQLQKKYKIDSSEILKFLKENNVELIFKHEKYKTKFNSKSPLYPIWVGMKQRCYNPNNGRYKNYGARGIEVCDEWKEDYGKFMEWAIQNGYKDGENLSIERIDNDKNYCPENCTWIPLNEQGKNQQRTRKIEYKGQVYTCQDLSLKLFGTPNLIRRRLSEGWSEEDAINVPRMKNQFDKK